MIDEKILSAIAFAKKSVSAGVAEANIENTFNAMSTLLKEIPLPHGALAAYETKLRAELEDGLAQRRKEEETRL